MSVDELLEEIEKGTEPHAEIELSREKVNPAAKEFTSKVSGEPVTGEKREDAFNDAAKIYNEAVGIKAEGHGAEQYGYMMRQRINEALGQEGLTAANNAIREGDIGTLLSKFQDAYTATIKGAKDSMTLAKVNALDKNDRLKIYQTTVEKLGGTDELRVVQNPQQAVTNLARLKGIAEGYK
ncbi:MAG: hypothetical protein IH934_00650 [Nanoarchaeota archaeon]|nr:hypothetical protein [Nanoarchaeota archaeon]